MIEEDYRIPHLFWNLTSARRIRKCTNYVKSGNPTLKRELVSFPCSLEWAALANLFQWPLLGPNFSAIRPKNNKMGSLVLIQELDTKEIEVKIPKNKERPYKIQKKEDQADHRAQ